MSITRRIINRARRKTQSREALASARSKKGGETAGGKSARLLKAWKTRKAQYGKSGSRRKAKEGPLKKAVKVAKRVLSGDKSKLPYKQIGSKSKYGTSSQRRYAANTQGRTKRNTGGGYARGRRGYKAGVSRYR